MRTARPNRRWLLGSGKRIFLLVGLLLLGAAWVAGQGPVIGPPDAQQGGRGAAGPGGRGRGSPFPTRAPADPAVVARGQQIFSANCSFCHGSDARGGETGPNLVRSQIVLDDQKGELIIPVVQSGRPDKGMPKFNLSTDDIAAVAAYLHSLMATYRGAPSQQINILVGDAKAGEAYFNGPGKCNICHTVSGDLAGVGAKYEPKALQNLIVSGGSGGRGGPAPNIPPTTVTVTLSSGQKIEGKLEHQDAFNITLSDSSGAYHDIAIIAGVKVDVHNPLQPHIDMLPNWDDTDIHNLTAYLATVK